MTTTCLQMALAGLMPHAPILIPSVGDERLPLCRATHNACHELARRLVASDADRLVLVSPHAPRHGDAFGVQAKKRLHGTLGTFGCPWITVDLIGDGAFATALAAAAAALSQVSWPIHEPQLDHGAVVPLWFLAEAGWRGPTTVVSLPQARNATQLHRLGHCIAHAAAECGGRTALIASGDMTHRAAPGAPAGYDVRALDFDQQVLRLVRAGELGGIAAIDDKLRALAAEDAADAVAVVAAALGELARGSEVLSYEHPFGVGYLVAVLHDGREAPRTQPLA